MDRKDGGALFANLYTPPVFSIHQSSVTRPLDPFWACASYLPPHLCHQTEATTPRPSESSESSEAWASCEVKVPGQVGHLSPRLGEGQKVDEHRLYRLYIGEKILKNG